MSLIDRAKNILFTPKTEWLVISNEIETPQSLLGKYVIPMALIPAIAIFIGYGLIGFDAGFFRITGIRWGLVMAVNSFVSSLISYFLCTYIIDALAGTFDSEKNIGRSAQLVAYSFTASWVAGIFSIIPTLGILSILGLYGIYLFYLGMPVMKKTPEEKRIGYMVMSALVIIVVSVAVGFVISRIIYAISGNPFMVPGSSLDNMRWR
jgi:Yip1 domain